jgi:acyl-coenzyme A synthetase/AMP-(fatty) acid ligase
VERDGQRWYRTGDLVVQDEEGLFHFLGRRDHEIKVRGYRIHPAEIMASLHRCAGLAESYVTTTTDERGGRALVAAVVPSDDAVVDPVALRASLREGLPEYMVPQRILVLDQLPKLPSGKVDDQRLALRFAVQTPEMAP